LGGDGEEGEMTVLVIGLADLKRLCAIDPGDTSQDDALTALQAAEQAVHEWALDPGILALAAGAGGDPGARATLTLGVAEVMAGGYLQTVARAGTISGFRVAGFEVVIPPGQTLGLLGSALTKQGLARLAPFTRAARSVAGAAAGLLPDDFAPIPQLIASTAPLPSVFDRVFRGADSGGGGDGFDGAPSSEWSGVEGGILWGGPEP